MEPAEPLPPGVMSNEAMASQPVPAAHVLHPATGHYGIQGWDNPKVALWSEAWMTSRKDRHAVAHKGAQMTQVQATDAGQRCRHIHQTRDAESGRRP